MSMLTDPCRAATRTLKSWKFLNIPKLPGVRFSDIHLLWVGFVAPLQPHPQVCHAANARDTVAVPAR